MQPPSLHSSFFSSLKQVEKRLKLENPSPPPTLFPPPPSQETYCTPSESLSSPIYLNFDQPNTSSNAKNILSLQSSEPPREFLSGSLDFPQTHEIPPPRDTVQDPKTINKAESDAVDEIQSLIQLLGFSNDEEGEKEGKGKGRRFSFGLKNGGGIRENCGHECGFYSKIIGVKGPKCWKEVERLEGWIKHYRNGGGEGRREPLRLAHLLLAKAASLSEGSDDFGKFEFPSTVKEYLHNDPTKD